MGHVFQEMPEISAHERLCDTVASVCEKKNVSALKIKYYVMP